MTPPQHLIDLAIQVSGWSPCRSKRGSVIFVGENVVAHGHNYKPHPFACDGSAACKAKCRTEAVHAEQRALLFAGPTASGAEMLHVKSVDGRLVPSGGPSCAQCSKLALAAGIQAMWLYHVDGWKRYETAEWHRLSLAALSLSGVRGPQEWQPIRTVPSMRNVLLSDGKDTTVGYRLGPGGRFVDSLDPEGFAFSSPIYWMPLPPGSPLTDAPQHEETKR